MRILTTFVPVPSGTLTIAFFGDGITATVPPFTSTTFDRSTNRASYSLPPDAAPAVAGAPHSGHRSGVARRS